MKISRLSESAEKEILKSFQSDLASYTWKHPVTGKHQPICCAVCDSAPKGPHWWEWITTADLATLCDGTNLHRSKLVGIYPNTLLDIYKVSDILLHPYILSPNSVVDTGTESIVSCKECISDMRHAIATGKQKRRRHPPK